MGCRAAGERACCVGRLHPLIDHLDQNIAASGDRIDAEVQELFRESMDTAFDWITPYQRLCTKLLKLASDRHDGTSKVLRTRPVEGEIDHEALSREFIARFPKLRAALAK